MVYNRYMKRISHMTKKPIFTAVGIVLAFICLLVYEFVIKDMMTANLPDGVLYAQFIDIGQGDSTLLTSPSGKFVLIDTGPGSSEEDLVDHLDSMGVETIEYLILTHPHEDHIGGTPSVLERYDVRNVIMPDATADTSIFRRNLEAIEKEGCETILAEPGDTYEFDSCKIELLGPLSTEGKDANNSSVVCKVTYGITSFMFTGDMEKGYEKELIEEYGGYLNCDVLKAGHHGSSTSSSEDFLDIVSPDTAVISCAEDNEYGHPHREVIKRLKDRGIEYHVTYEDGTVILVSDGNGVELYND